MKTISIPTASFIQLTGNQPQPEAISNRAFLKMTAHRGSVAEWLPTPALPRALPAGKSRRNTSAKRAPSIWLPFERETFVERLMLLALVFGAMIAIGYGFSCFLDLAQNWAGFNAAVDQLIR